MHCQIVTRIYKYATNQKCKIRRHGILTFFKVKYVKEFNRWKIQWTIRNFQSGFSNYTMWQECKPTLGLKLWRYDLVWFVAVFCVLCNPVNGFFCSEYSFSVPCPLVELLTLVLRDPGRIWNSNYTNQIRNLTSQFFGTWKQINKRCKLDPTNNRWLCVPMLFDLFANCLFVCLLAYFEKVYELIFILYYNLPKYVFSLKFI